MLFRSCIAIQQEKSASLGHTTTPPLPLLMASTEGENPSVVPSAVWGSECVHDGAGSHPALRGMLPNKGQRGLHPPSTTVVTGVREESAECYLHEVVSPSNTEVGRHVRQSKGEDIQALKKVKLVGGEAYVGVESTYKNLSYFDFAPNVAPTQEQLFPHLVTHHVFVASGGDKPLIDRNIDWIIDSGCTSHMSNNRSSFADFREIDADITTAGLPTKVTGIGTAKLKAELPDKITNFSLSDTLLVPSLPVNLISMSKLDIKFYMSTKYGFQIKSKAKGELFLEARVVRGPCFSFTQFGILVPQLYLFMAMSTLAAS